MHLGIVESIGASGNAWAGFRATSLSEMFFDEIKRANKSIQICSFSVGHKTPVLEKFFSILREQLENPPMKISIIINDSAQNASVTPYARGCISRLEREFPGQFFPQYFSHAKGRGASGILHAKVTVIDGKTALIGSANLSKGALETNYEIVIKISGQVAADLSAMLSRLSSMIRDGRA